MESYEKGAARFGLIGKTLWFIEKMFLSKKNQRKVTLLAICVIHAAFVLNAQHV